MLKEEPKKNSYKTYRWIFLLYSLVGLLLLPFFRYYVDAVDMVCYTTIAQKYATGNWYEAINDLWAPLISWLLAPILLFKIDPFLAFKFLQIIIGVFALHNILQLIETTSLNDTQKKIIAFAFIPFVLSAGLLNGAPDLLFLALLLLYLRSITARDYVKNGNGFYVGLLGALMYFAKSYGFPFFIVHFLLINIIYFFRSKETERKIIKEKVFKGFISFLILSGAWVVAISIKNNHFVISGNGSYNFALIGPANSNRATCAACHPLHENGLREPYTASAVNAAEEHNKIGIQSWNPFLSMDDFNYYLRQIKTNILSIYYNDFKRQYGGVVLIALFLFLFFIRKIKLPPFSFHIYLLTLIVYNSGYILVHTNPRYLWINAVLLTTLFLMLKPFFARYIKFKIIYYLLFSFLIILLVKRPVKELLFLRDKDVSSIIFLQSLYSPVNTVSANIFPHKHLYEIARQVAQRTDLKGNAANKYKSGGEDYVKTTIICFYSGNKHFGELTDTRIRNEGYKQIRDFNIDFYYSWQALPDTDATFIRPPVFTDSLSGLCIYKVRKK